jgi:hypothetical protein
MKKTYLIYMIVALFALQLVAAAPSFQVSLSKYDPYPASPGDTVKVWLLIQNTASNDDTDTARNVVMELIPSYPFSIYNDDAIKTISLLGAKKDYLIDFNLKVDEKALQGTNTFKVRVKDSNSNIQIEETAAILVQSRDTTIAIDSVKIDPAQITPGSDGTVTLTVKNVAPNSFTDLSLKLYLQSVIGGVLVDLPFAPVDSSTEKRIYRLDPGQTAEFKYDLRVYPDATAKIYKIPFTLEYYDNLGNKRNKTDFIGVTVNSVPEVSVILDKTDITQKKTTGDITLKVINKGLGDIKFLNVILKQGDSYQILSTTDTIYVGNLQSDDYQSVDYTIAVKDDANAITVPVTLQYRDANNQYYEVTEDVPLNIVDSSKLDAANGGGVSGVMIFVIVVVVALAGWFIYRKIRKDKKK